MPNSCYCNFFIKLFFVLLVSIAFHVKGQSTLEVKPSHNAKQFMINTSSINNMETGQMSLNIPLFTLEGLGITIPISFGFSSAGIQHNSQPSFYGLGW